MRKIVVVICLLAMGSGAWALAEAPRVAVAPFVVHSQQDASKIRQVLGDLLNRQLSAEGVATIEPDEVAAALGSRGPVASESEARALGSKLDADFVLFGSLSQVGDYFSVDARLVDVSGQKKTEVLFTEERGVENLALAANQLTQQAAVQLLEKAIIADVHVRGNERIEADAIKANVKSVKGELLRPQQVSEDIKSIHRMGFFEDVQADVTDSPEGKVLTFVVRENPTVQEVKLKGNKKIKEKDLLAAVSTKPFTVLQKNVVNEDVQRILRLYHEKAYFNAQVESDVSFPRDPRNAVVTFSIKENNKIFIQDIDFTGNEHFSDRKLRRVMETKQRGFFHWFSDKGIMQKDKLETDLDRLTVFYHDKGFMDARVGTPDVNRTDDGFFIKIPVQEGARYKVQEVKMTGDPLDDEKTAQELSKNFDLKEGKYFSRENLRTDMDSITKAYMNEGYAYAQVNPNVQKDPAAHTATVAFDVNKGQKVTIGKITVSGNTKTRDKVIRRQLRINEGDTFSAKKLEDSTTNLKRLDYFENVELSPAPEPEPETLNLDVKVKEKLTGSISVGGGLSSEDGLFASGEIVQRNLFGKGLILGLRAYLGGEAQRYSISFTEPFLFDTPLSAGIDLYDWYREYSDFTKDAQGGKLRFGYPFGNWSHFYVAYVLENAKITDVSEDAALLIRDQEGEQLKSSVIFSMARDTTDHPFLPTKGSINSISTEFSSPYLGSESDFISTTVDSGWYFPIYWKFIGFIRGKAGYIAQLDEEDNPVPIYERFFLGGINSLRAFDFADVGPRDPETGDIIGGTKFGLVNLELLFPIAEKLGIRGVVFFDAGNAFDDDESFDVADFRTDAGTGIRWNSPLGPLRVEWGYNLDPEPGEDSYNWQFTMGAFF